MKHSFVFAATLAILASAPLPSRGEEATLTPLLSACRTQRGVVLVSPEPPHNPIKTFCADELKRFDCQILFQITNYIYYSYGECGNHGDMIKQSFSRPACNGLNAKELSDFNRKAFQTIPDEVKRFFFTLTRIEYDKGCLPPNFTPRDY